MGTRGAFKKWNALLVLGLLWPASSFPMAGKVQEKISQPPIVHEVELVDPLHPAESHHVYPLRLSFDGNGFPAEYALSLKAEVCMEQVCNPVDVTLVWDALGRYRRLDLPPGTPLTKLEHVPFRPEDYARLDEILGDPASILGSYPIGFFQDLKTKRGKVDGVTAATPVAVRNAVVEGAAYTSWVLWHWVNGEAAEKMRALTALHATTDYIEDCLKSTDPDFVRFALSHILKNAKQDPQYRDECFQILETGRRRNGRLALQYLTEGSMEKKELHRRLAGLIGINPGSSGLIIHYFETQRELDPKLRKQLAERLDRLPPYDLYAVLDLLDNDEETRVQVKKLLDSDNAYVVRCAQEFLDRTDAE